jgi:hypothetical protein
MKIDIQQGTPEWFAARMGLATGSEWKKAMSGAKEWSDTAMSYAMQIAAERIGGTDEYIETPAMARGSALESDALDMYEESRFAKVLRGTFHVHERLALGCSPDGETHDGGIVEVKCMKASKHAAVWHTEAVPDEHHVQVQFNLWLTGAAYCDYVSFHPGVPERLQMCVVRAYPFPEMIDAMQKRAERFLALVDSISDKLGATGWKPYHLTTR